MVTIVEMPPSPTLVASYPNAPQVPADAFETNDDEEVDAGQIQFKETDYIKKNFLNLFKIQF